MSREPAPLLKSDINPMLLFMSYWLWYKSLWHPSPDDRRDCTCFRRQHKPRTMGQRQCLSCAGRHGDSAKTGLGSWITDVTKDSSRPQSQSRGCFLKLLVGMYRRGVFINKTSDLNFIAENYSLMLDAGMTENVQRARSHVNEDLNPSRVCHCCRTRTGLRVRSYSSIALCQQDYKSFAKFIFLHIIGWQTSSSVSTLS